MRKTISAAVLSLFMIAIGICLLINPEGFVSYLFYILGAAVIVFAAAKTAFDAKDGVLKYTYLFRILTALLGIVLMVIQKSIVDIIPTIIGVMLLIYAIFKLNGAFLIKRFDEATFRKLLIGAIIQIVLSILVIIFSATLTNLVFRIIGVILFYTAAENFISTVISKNSPKGNTTIYVESHESDNQQ